MKKIKKLLLSVMVALMVLGVMPEGIYGLNTSVEVQAAVKVGTPKLIAVKASGTSQIKLGWEKVKGASGYRIYRRTDGTSWKTIKIISGGSVVSYTDNNLNPGTRYIYTVRAYRKENGKTVWGRYDKKGVNAVTGIAAPKFSVKESKTEDCAIEISISSTSGARGYVIYRKTGSGKSWTRIAVTRSSKYIDKKVKKGVTYTYTVKAYSTYSGKNYYGLYNKKGISYKIQSATDNSYFTKLKNYVLVNGYTNKYGNKVIKDTNYDEGFYFTWNILYDQNKNQFEFSFATENGDMKDVLFIQVKENPSYVNPEYILVFENSSSGFSATANFKASSYNEQKLYFEIESDGLNNDYTVMNNLANASLRLAFAGWEDILHEKLNMSLRNLGFTSYYPN